MKDARREIGDDADHHQAATRTVAHHQKHAKIKGRSSQENARVNEKRKDITHQAALPRKMNNSKNES